MTKDTGIWPKLKIARLEGDDEVDVIQFDAAEDFWAEEADAEFETYVPLSTAEELADHLENCLGMLDGERRVGPDNEAREFLSEYRKAVGNE